MDEVTLFQAITDYIYTLIADVDITAENAKIVTTSLLDIVHKNGFEVISKKELDSLKEKAWMYDDLCD